jgi:hypothetical protein
MRTTILENIAGDVQLANRMSYAMSDAGYDALLDVAMGFKRMPIADINALVDEAIQSSATDGSADNTAAQRVADIIARIYGTLFQTRIIPAGTDYDGMWLGSLTVAGIVDRARAEYGETEPKFMRELECAIRRTFIGIYSK